MGARPLKALVLGSSAAWPIPRLGCDCDQCTSSDPRDQRLRSSLLVDGRILVDAGPDAYEQLRIFPRTAGWIITAAALVAVVNSAILWQQFR